MSYQSYEQWKSIPLDVEPVVSIVIPVYNEEIRIVPTIGAIASHMATLDHPWELIVADDGSKDDTVPVVQELNLANLRLLIAEQNGGKGSAVQRGMMAARGRFILFADADNSTPIEEFGRLLAKLTDEGYDVAVGSRAADGAEVANKSMLRHLMSWGLNWIVRNIFGIRIKDTQCGFKLFSRAATRKLFGTQTIMGFSFDLEILYLASKFGFNTAEVPVTWYDAPGSKVDSFKEARRFLTSLLEIKLKDWRGEYDGVQRAGDATEVAKA